MIDTGSNRTAMNPASDFYEKFTFTKKGVMISNDLHIDAEEGILKNIRFGGQDISNINVVAYEFPESKRIVGKEYAMILGMDILKQFKMELNFDDGLLKIGEFVPAEKGWEKIPVTIYEGRPYVECAIGEIEGTFLIDSGSNTEIRFPESEFEYLVNDSTIQIIENQ